MGGSPGERILLCKVIAVEWEARGVGAFRGRKGIYVCM